MNPHNIRIDQLKLRVDGLSKDEGRDLGNQVAQMLSRVELKHRTQRFDRLNVTVTRNHSGSVATIAKQIVTEIKRKLT